MTRPGRLKRGSGPTVSLFPFLAVLLCTMGMLIMLLVLISSNTAELETAAAAQNAPSDPLFSEAALDQLDEETNAPPAVPGPESASSPLSPEDEELYTQFRRAHGNITPEDLELQRESAEWFLSELEGVRDRTRGELTNERAKLAEAETEINKLVTELLELNRRAADLSGQTDSQTDADTLQKEIDAKAGEIASLNRQIEELRQKAGESAEKPAYAILPYRGKSGTFRRPIYVECDENGIRLMPERVQFVPEDFLVAKYPGNPFDAGLRAARQYFIETGQGDSENEPYPLLILKPESAQTYYIAKSALASWGGEFGYEFVESDAEIEYPRPDPELRRRVEEQVAMARARLAGPIAALMNKLEAEGREARLPDEEETDPQTFGEEGDFASQLGPYARLDSHSAADGTAPGLYHAPGNGNPAPAETGFARDASGAPQPGTGTEPETEHGGYLTAPAETGFARDESGAAGAPQPGTSTEPETEPGGHLTAPAEGSRTATAEPDLSGGSADPSATGEMQLLSDEELLPGTPSDGKSPEEGPASGLAAESPEDAGTGSPVYVQGAEPYSSPGAGEISTPFAEITAAGKTDSGDEQAPGIDPRQTVGNTAFLPGRGGTASPAAEETEAAAANGQAAADMKEHLSAEEKKVPKEPRVKAQRDKRAINLAEELKKPTQTSIERPITVICGEGTVLFPAQAGIRDAKRLELRSEEDRQAVLRTIVACVRGWHAAGRNMYWTPWIRIKTEPGGEQTAEQLQLLMQSQRVRVERADGEAP